VPSYRTEILIPADRYVCLQLPPHLPEGLATITVHVHVAGPDDPPDDRPAPEPERQDIEWWEEFEGDREGLR
jgi:hypothetical protein